MLSSRTLVFSTLLMLLAHGVAAADELFPPELTRFKPHDENPLFAGGPDGAWDQKIRGRGWILKEGDQWRMYYTGYDAPEPALRRMGYATSTDGVHWKRVTEEPVFADLWVEDICVVKHAESYYLFAEGEPRSHWFTSSDGWQWEPRGSLKIRDTKGGPVDGHAATPCVFVNGDDWYLYYQNTGGVWVATGGPEEWTNIKDEPVIHNGPEPYDSQKSATDQVFAYKGRYYMYYHGRGVEPIHETYLAVSDDLVNWTKYPGNPVIGNNFSSGILVDDGARLRMYTMHDKVRLFWSDPNLSENLAD